MARRSPLSEVDEREEQDPGDASVSFKITVRGAGLHSTEMKIRGSTPSGDGRSPRVSPPLYLANGAQAVEERKSPGHRSGSNIRIWSRYHSGCSVRGSEYLDWTSTKNSHSDRTNRPHKDHRRYKAGTSGGNKGVPGTDMDNEIVAGYLDRNENFLEDYVASNVSMEQLERWIIRRMKTDRDEDSDRKGSLSRWKFCVHADKRKMLQEITESLMNHPTQEQVLWELGKCIGSAVGVDGFHVFRMRRSEPDTISHLIRNKDDKEVKVVYIPASKYPQIVKMAQKTEPKRYSLGRDIEVPSGVGFSYSGAENLLFQTIVQPDNETVAILEMWRSNQNFNEEDEEISSSYLVWGGIALHYAKLYHEMNMQRSLADFLLTVVKSIFQNMVSIESLVTKVMNFAQKLVDADRASLFLVDSKTLELYATVFDLGCESTNFSSSGSEGSQSMKKEIRFPIGTGIAGHVAQTGEILNIKNAYEDSRFNRTVDLITGYKTKTILCMPIYIRGIIIGVVQMVNKRDGVFSDEDEKNFEMFAVYCGLALHHAKLYDKIMRSEQKYKVALDVLSYHNTCSEEEVEAALNDVRKATIAKMDEFSFNPFVIEDYQKATHAIHMFIDLFGLNHFDRTELVKFVLTVRKNYRRVPYHNWTHGFSVANSMYNILKRTQTFKNNEKLALFIGCLCHDLDHRGKSNKFMSDIESPLAAIYSTSTMEHHHFNQTVTILQQEGHNIFRMLSSQDYKEVLGLLKHCILATDLAAFFPNKAKLEALVKDKQFLWTKSEHRSLILAVTMTAADLSASAKPWDIQVETVKVIFKEFYEQGDEERAAGREPIPMMDRQRPEEQAASQVGFLTGICIPCYTLLNKLIPETQPLLTTCQENLERWKTGGPDVKQIMEVTIMREEK